MEVDGQKLDASEVFLDSATGKLRMYAGNDQHDYEVVGEINDATISAQINVDFGASVQSAQGIRLDGVKRDRQSKTGEIPTANRQEPTQDESPSKPPKSDAPSASDTPSVSAGEQPQAPPGESRPRNRRRRGDFAGRRPGQASDQPGSERSGQSSAANNAQAAANQEPAPVDPNDKLSGTWHGEFSGAGNFRGNAAGFDLVLKRDAKHNITGSMSTGRGDTQITGGTFDEETGALHLDGENEFSTMEINAKLENGILKGSFTAGGGRFEIQFEASRGGNQTANLPKGDPLEKLVPGPRWVSSLSAHRFAPGRVYATLDGHRSDDDALYVFVSEDYGATWRSLKSNLPDAAGSVRVLREDVINENLLFLGCEFSAWVSIDRGQSWTKISGLPTVAVHEFAIHETAGEVVAATHGRSLWIADVSWLRQLTPTDLASGDRLLKPNSMVRWFREPTRGSSGTRRFVGTNPPNDATFAYVFNSNASQVELVVRRPDGTRLKTLTGSTERGLNLVRWDFSVGDTPIGGRGRRFRGNAARPGTYVVDFVIDGSFRQAETLEVLADPTKLDVEVAEQQGDDVQFDEEELEEFLEMMGGGENE